ncbi:sortase-associated OmpA-like protein PdsO [Parashewanella spongiae]|uniref:Sortase-associated OmpA-like protein PdsO n=1 Tax=Parashewanella spongiae TaxID=342950 RepID=A0A3A6UJR7_9GAMM|nr:sortase-associated OmpA-like protein PdsO [Parashewanella spongiae]MCL1078393.1 sortase-associated OmpA-like protein PdsO [Parashewanella spongiae]RJY19424.1 sortase-associated OmpA-like protein PdsO [Parashewanella spongiae]
MKKSLITTVVIGSLLASNISFAAASNQEVEPHGEQEQLIGFGSGLIIGALVGGPVGAVIGAFTGGVVGKSVADDTKLDSQQVKINEQEMRIARLASKSEKYDDLAHRYSLSQQKLNQLSQADKIKLDELALGMNVQFRTGSSKIEPIFEKQLNEVAEIMKISTAMKLDLSGYADRTGKSQFNQELSEKRMSAVLNYLVERGIEQSRFITQAYGDTAPLTAESSLENNFFDRRVTLKLVPSSVEGVMAKN